MKTLYFIVNPKAGNGKSLSVWSKIEKRLKGDHIPYSVNFTERSGHAKELTKSIINSHNKSFIYIIVVGGDGTINEVVNGLANNLSQVKLGLIPAGSGNDFSRGYHIPRNTRDAYKLVMKLINEKEDSNFDLGMVEMTECQKHYFVNSTGVGLDAYISYEANRTRWKSLFNRLSLGQIVYAILLLKNIFTYKCSTFNLVIDGKKYSFPNTWFVTASNQPFYGGGMKIAPKALANDGLLNITIVHNLSRLKLLLVFLSVFWGKHIYFKEVSHYLANSVCIQSNLPAYVHSDGEFIGLSPLNIRVHNEPLTILTQVGR